MKKKKLFLNKLKTKYCWIKLFETKKEMQIAYAKCENGSFNGTTIEKVDKKLLGGHRAYQIIDAKSSKCDPETGTLYLNLDYCGAGVVSHEIMHAILWSHKHDENKSQYPFTIKDMAEEEEILHNLTNAVCEFYNWYFKITKNGKFK